MSRKKKTKGRTNYSFFQPSVSWLPAFFAGLCLGILIHLIPGMDILLREAHQQKELVEEASEQPIMWRPQISRHS